MQSIIDIHTNRIFDRVPELNVDAEKKPQIEYKKMSNTANMARISDMIEIEIDNIKSKKWNCLPKCIKWIKIQDYAKTHSISNKKINNLKKLIGCNKLSEVSYDHLSGKIKMIPPHYLKVNSGL